LTQVIYSYTYTVQLKNTETKYGLLSIALHWSVALIVLILLPLGLWTTSLDYYDPWYKKGPDLHRSLGVIAGILIMLRITWRFYNVQPKTFARHWEQRLARLSHSLLYLLPILLIISGYLTSTADGRPVDVFDWFSIPAVLSNLENQEDIAGWMHYILGLTLIFTIFLHVTGALKHHFIDKDNTLKRIFGK